MSLQTRRAVAGLEINEKIQSHFAIRYENLVAISQILVAKSKMANDRRNGAVHVTSQLNYYTITLPSEKIHSEKQNNFVIYLLLGCKPSRKVGRFPFFFFLVFFSVSVKVLPVTPLVSGVFVHRAFCAYFRRIERVVELRKFLWWTQ